MLPDWSGWEFLHEQYRVLKDHFPEIPHRFRNPLLQWPEKAEEQRSTRTSIRRPLGTLRFPG